MMISKHLVLLFVALMAATWLRGQTERDIKLSGDYYWGESENANETEARNAALQDMLFKITVTVSSEVFTREQNVNNQYQDEARSQVQATSSLTLEGVEFQTKTRKGNYVVLAYISRANYEKSIRTLATEINSLAASAELDERQLGVQATVIHFYRAYLKALRSPQPIAFVSSRGESYPNIQVFLHNKVTAFLNDLEIQPGAAAIDASLPMTTVPVTVTYRGQPVSHLVVRPNIPDAAETEVVGGKGQFFRYSMPSGLREHYDLSFWLNPDPQTTPEDLRRLHATFKISHSKKITVDYSPLIRVGFNVYLQASGALLFKPFYANLSISDLVWDFGDGETSVSQNPLHRYAAAGVYPVTLTLNNNPDLTIRKNVSTDGKMSDPWSAPPVVPPLHDAARPRMTGIVYKTPGFK